MPNGRAQDQDAFALLRELEQNTPESIRRARMHHRLVVKSPVVAQPANMSDRLRMKVKGTSGDISQGGCCILFPIPLHVGDIYRLTFEGAAADLPSVFARCLRCRLIREDAYEAGFAFFEEIDVDALADAEDERRRSA